MLGMLAFAPGLFTWLTAGAVELITGVINPAEDAKDEAEEALEEIERQKEYYEEQENLYDEYDQAKERWFEEQLENAGKELELNLDLIENAREQLNLQQDTAEKQYQITWDKILTQHKELEKFSQREQRRARTIKRRMLDEIERKEAAQLKDLKTENRYTLEDALRQKEYVTADALERKERTVGDSAERKKRAIEDAAESKERTIEDAAESKERTIEDAEQARDYAIEDAERNEKYALEENELIESISKGRAQAKYGTANVRNSDTPLQMALQLSKFYTEKEARIKEEKEISVTRASDRYEKTEGRAEEDYETIEGRAEEDYETIESRTEAEHEKVKSRAEEDYQTILTRAEEQYDTVTGRANERLETLTVRIEEHYDALEKEILEDIDYQLEVLTDNVRSEKQKLNVAEAEARLQIDSFLKQLDLQRSKLGIQAEQLIASHEKYVDQLWWGKEQDDWEEKFRDLEFDFTFEQLDDASGDWDDYISKVDRDMGWQIAGFAFDKIAEIAGFIVPGAGGGGSSGASASGSSTLTAPTYTNWQSPYQKFDESSYWTY